MSAKFFKRSKKRRYFNFLNQVIDKIKTKKEKGQADGDGFFADVFEDELKNQKRIRSFNNEISEHNRWPYV